MSDPSYLRYWGKARPDPGVEEKSHPLAYHSLDVAAVGTALLEADARLRRWLAALLGLSEDVAVPLMQVVLALHCQTAFNIDPRSACKIDPPERHGGGCPGSQ